MVDSCKTDIIVNLSQNFTD